MNYSNPAPLPPDDLDRLLSRELPKLLPQPFPAFDAPTTPRMPGRSWDTSRVTLTLSVAALLGLGLVVGPTTRQRPQNEVAKPSTNLLDQSSADGQEILKRLKLEPKASE